MPSYKTDMLCRDEWVSNALRFATTEEAEAYGKHVMRRWTIPSDRRVVETQDPVSHRFEEDQVVKVSDSALDGGA